MQTLSQYLEAESISQAEFARRLGVAQPNVNRWAAGVVVPRRETMEAIERETDGAVGIASWFLPASSCDEQATNKGKADAA